MNKNRCKNLTLLQVFREIHYFKIMFLILFIVQAIGSNIAAGTLAQINKNITCVLNI
jgi:hypothetical protein